MRVNWELLVGLSAVTLVLALAFYPFQPRQVRCGFVASANRNGGNGYDVVVKLKTGEAVHVVMPVAVNMIGEEVVVTQWWSGHWTVSDAWGCP